MSFNEFLNESSMTRFISKFKKHDAAILTAFRGEYTKSENLQRNKKLFASLFAKGYSVTSVKGSYIENKGYDNELEVSENSFVVVNHKDDENFEHVIFSLGEYFEQDSILLIHKGEKPTATLVGTSKLETSFPGYKVRKDFSHMTLKTDTQEFFTRLNKKTFAFPDDISESQIYESEFYPQTINGKRAAKIDGNELLTLLNI